MIYSDNNIVSLYPHFAPSHQMLYFARMDSDFLLVINTCPDETSAEMIANTLVDQSLAACVNIVPGIRSIYQWKGKRCQGQEHLLLIKARADKYQAIESTIKTMHPYELPEIIAVSITTGLKDYLAWINETQ